MKAQGLKMKELIVLAVNPLELPSLVQVVSKRMDIHTGMSTPA